MSRTITAPRGARPCGRARSPQPLLSRSGFGQAYPAKPVTVIIPFGAGGTTDLVGRIICEKLTQRLGQGLRHREPGRRRRAIPAWRRLSHAAPRRLHHRHDDAFDARDQPQPLQGKVALQTV